MRDETDFTAIPLQARKDAGAELSIARVFGLTATLVLHGVLLLTVLRPANEAPGTARLRVPLQAAAPSSMALVLLNPPAATSLNAPRADMSSARLPSMTVIFRAPASRPSAAAPVAAAESPTPSAASSELSTADLSEQKVDIAKQMAGPLTERSNQTLPTLPGAAIGVNLHAPVKRWKQITPEQVGGVLARIFVATMAANPDDYEKIRDGRDPLQEWTSAHLNSFDEPHCDDPEDPLRDRRCYDDNPNLRR